MVAMIAVDLGLNSCVEHDSLGVRTLNSDEEIMDGAQANNGTILAFVLG